MNLDLSFLEMKAVQIQRLLLKTQLAKFNL